jgi:hypothetical protein
MTTVVNADPSGVQVTQTDTYVVGNEFYRTDITVRNNSQISWSGKVYHAGDCYLDGSDTDFGAVDGSNNGIACAANPNNSPPGALMEFAPIIGGSHYFEGAYRTAFTTASNQGDYSNTCDCAVQEDNGMGINWDFGSLPPGQQVTFSMLSKFSDPPSGVATGTPTATSSSAVLSGTANPNGVPTTGRWIFGLDASERGPGFNGNIYDQSTPSQSVGSDSSSHTISARVSNLMPNSLYHAKFIATNSDGTTIGPDVVFTTAPARVPAPVLGKENFTPIGTVFILAHGQFVKLTQTLQLPSGTVVDAQHGGVSLVAANGGSGKASDAKAKKRKKATRSTGTFSGAVFKVTQAKSGPNKGLTTISLVDNAFKGAPSYASCKAKRAADPVAQTALSRRVLQTLRSRGSGRFRSRGRYAAGTVLGTAWTTTDRCDGTLIAVQQHSVLVTDLVKHITVLVRAGHHYLAKAPAGRKHK